MVCFARIVRKRPDRDKPHAHARATTAVFMQGGPGCPSPGLPLPGWVLDLAAPYEALVLLDQRGTGMSSGVSLGHIADMTRSYGATATAAWLTALRAPQIVNDAERLRAALGISKWAVIGQSYGGFIACTYLAMAPGSLSEVLITGGLPELPAAAPAVAARRVYERAIRSARAANTAYFRAFPQDAARMRAVCRALDSTDVRLPDGSRLSSRRFRTAGQCLGLADGESVLHKLLETAFAPAPGGELPCWMSSIAADLRVPVRGTACHPAVLPLRPDARAPAATKGMYRESPSSASPPVRDSSHTRTRRPSFGEPGQPVPNLVNNASFLAVASEAVDVAVHPLYFLLHESIYAMGAVTEAGTGATNWAAWDMLQRAGDLVSGDGTPFWYSEMMFPWLMEDVPALAAVRPVAQALAAWEDWPAPVCTEAALRDIGQSVPIAAAVYSQDVYVPYELSASTAALLGAKTWDAVGTSHSELRDAPRRVLPALWGLLDAQ